MLRLKSLLCRLIPEYSRVPLVLCLLWHLGSYYGGRLLSHGLYHRLIEMPLDRSIPFLNWTISIYILSYVFWVVNYILAARLRRAHAFRFFCADFLTRVVCLIFYVALPTVTVLRPEADWHGGFWDWLCAFIFAADTPDCLFPSMHCIASYICTVAIATDRRIPLWYRIFSFVFTAAICVSVLTTKQHVVADAISGIIIADLFYRLAAIKKLPLLYERACSRLRAAFLRLFPGKGEEAEE